MPDPPNPPEQPDQAERVTALLAAAVRGGRDAESAWREIIHLYGRRVYALAHSRCRRADIAEEVTQSVFATVAAKLESGYTEQGRFESWLFRIAMNRIRDEVRRLRRHAEPREPASFVQLHAPEAEEQTDESQLRLLRGALERLTPADREIIELRHHGEMSFREMSELLNEPLGTLLARHHRALRKLKQFMEQQPADEREITSKP